MSYERIASAWEQALRSKLRSEGVGVVAFHPDQYVPGDLQSIRETLRPLNDMEVMNTLLLKDWPEPIAFGIDSKSAAFGNLGDSIWSGIIVVPDAGSESVLLLAISERRLETGDLEALRRGDKSSSIVHARLLCEQRGATIELHNTRSGDITFSVERRIKLSDLNYLLKVSEIRDGASGDYPYAQIQDFGETLRAADVELRGRAQQSGGCYIATAVYGSYDTPQVLILRGFRDERLARSAPGRTFIRAYYAVSPAMAKYFERAAPLNRIARTALDAVVRRIENASRTSRGGL